MAKSADEARKAATQRYQDQIIPPGGIITNPTTSGITGYQGTTTAVNEDAKILYNMPESERKIIAQRLKNAGYKVAITGKYSDNLLSAYLNASMKATLQSQFVGQSFTVRQYLEQEAANRIAQGAGTGTGSKTPDPFVQKTISTKTQIRDVANEIARDLIGRGLSEEQFNKYYKLATEREKTMPTKTTYKKLKGGGTEATTTGGPDTKEFLYQQIAGTDEAKQNKIFSFYDAFKTAIGVK